MSLSTHLKVFAALFVGYPGRQGSFSIPVFELESTAKGSDSTLSLPSVPFAKLLHPGCPSHVFWGADGAVGILRACPASGPEFRVLKKLQQELEGVVGDQVPLSCFPHQSYWQPKVC